MKTALGVVLVTCVAALFGLGAALDLDGDVTTADAIACALVTRVNCAPQDEDELARDGGVVDSDGVRPVTTRRIVALHRIDRWLTVALRRWQRAFLTDVPI